MDTNVAIAYILPHYDPRDATHMSHIPRFLSELSKYCRVHAIIWRGEAPFVAEGVCEVVTLGSGSIFARSLRLLSVVRRLVKLGCRTFFVRISTPAALQLGLVKKIFGLRVYLWASGRPNSVVPPYWPHPGRRVRYLLSMWSLRASLAVVDGLVTGPETMAKFYAEEFGINPERIILLYNDIDLWRVSKVRHEVTRESARESLAVSPEDKVVLFVGRVSPMKGMAHLVRVGARLQKVTPHARLLVVGKVHGNSGIVEECRRLGLTNIEFLGPVANAEVFKYYLAADVAILPSESEGFPRVLLEAMAFGTPIVAFDVGGIGDIVHPWQLDFVVPRGEVDVMCDKIARLLGDSRLAREQTQAGLAGVTRFSTEEVARMFVRNIVLH